MRNRFKRNLKKIVIVAAVFITLAAGFAFKDNSFEISKNLDIFVTLFKTVDNYYVDEVDPAKLIRKAIDEMLKTLDPYTTFIPESEAEDLRFMTTGSYGGVGATVAKRGDYIQIAEPYYGFPAYKAGLMAGDIVLEIDGKSTKDKSVSDVSSILKGQPNTEISLLLQRPGVEKPFTKILKRANIHLDNVPYHGMVGDGIAYITLSAFKENATNDIINSLNDLKKKGPIKGLILDLRGNPGGLLMEAVDVTNLFVEKDMLVVSTKGKVEQWNKEYKTRNTPLDLDVPLIVLVNNSSASASEIVAGALQDLDRAVIMGSKTYGKGLVQTTRPLSYNSSLKVTTAKYYIPSGRCIQQLDYANRDKQGRATRLADSLITEFKTKNGRKVFDGAGIKPDITVSDSSLPEIVRTLISDNLIFDFATDYRTRIDSIDAPEKFKLTDKEYQDFIAFVSAKNLNYRPPTEKALASLEKESKADKYFNDIKPYYDSIAVVLNRNKKRDLMAYKKDISEMLEEEIISRYYYQKGRIKYKLTHDSEIEKAKALFDKPELYKLVLTPQPAKN
jgi:carboxyl-terminal processing protease